MPNSVRASRSCGASSPPAFRAGRVTSLVAPSCRARPPHRPRVIWVIGQPCLLPPPREPAHRDHRPVCGPVPDHSIAPVESHPCRRLVRSPGVIICAVPNHASLSALVGRLKRSKTRYGGVDIVYHSIAYSPRSLRKSRRVRVSAGGDICDQFRDPTWGQVADFGLVGPTYHRMFSMVRMPSLAVAAAQVA